MWEYEWTLFKEPFVLIPLSRLLPNTLGFSYLSLFDEKFDRSTNLRSTWRCFDHKQSLSMPIGASTRYRWQNSRDQFLPSGWTVSHFPFAFLSDYRMTKLNAWGIYAVLCRKTFPLNLIEALYMDPASFRFSLTRWLTASIHQKPYRLLGNWDLHARQKIIDISRIKFC